MKKDLLILASLGKDLWEHKVSLHPPIIAIFSWPCSPKGNATSGPCFVLPGPGHILESLITIHHSEQPTDLWVLTTGGKERRTGERKKRCIAACGHTPSTTASKSWISEWPLHCWYVWVHSEALASTAPGGPGRDRRQTSTPNWPACQELLQCQKWLSTTAGSQCRPWDLQYCSWPVHWCCCHE